MTELEHKSLINMVELQEELFALGCYRGKHFKWLLSALLPAPYYSCHQHDGNAKLETTIGPCQIARIKF